MTGADDFVIDLGADSDRLEPDDATDGVSARVAKAYNAAIAAEERSDSARHIERLWRLADRLALRLHPQGEQMLALSRAVQRGDAAQAQTLARAIVPHNDKDHDAVVKKLVDALTASAIGDARWLTTEQAAKRLGMSKRQLERLKADADAAGVKVPCRNAGRGAERQRLVWNQDKLDSFMEDQSWRQFDRAAASPSSRGGASPASNAGARVRTRKPRGSSSSTSKPPSRSGATGSLMSHYEKLTSKR
jgi:hypothetical protein